MISYRGTKKATDEPVMTGIYGYKLEPGMQPLPSEARPIYVVSDLHAADGGPRDSFSYGGREKQFDAFLDHVDANSGQLVIAGDLLDLWQCNISSVLTYRRPLLNRLREMGAIYVLGNHDSDLNYFIGTGLINHRLITHAVRKYTARAGGKVIDIIHGHEADPFCISDVPGIGRITAIMSGIAEDRNGGPMINESKSVAQKVVGPMDRFVSHFDWLRGKPSRSVAMNRELKKHKDGACDILISGHTHLPGRIGDWYYNTGTWAEFKNSFVEISPDGVVTLFDWNDGNPVVDETRLKI